MIRNKQESTECATAVVIVVHPDDDVTRPASNNKLCCCPGVSPVPSVNRMVATVKIC